MKTKLPLLIVFGLIWVTSFSQFQFNVAVANENFHDLNIAPLALTTDYIVSGNFFDAAMQTEELFLKRVDQNGNVVWLQKYSAPGLQHARAFDVISFGDFIIMTGSVDVGGSKRVFIAKFLSTNGSFFGAEFYSIVAPNFNSRGLKIKVTQSDVNGDGTADLGFVVAGFFSDCYNVNINCPNNNIGFVLRTDFNLLLQWVREIDTNNTSNTLELDFANDITETSDGYFITGSATGNIPGTPWIQGILAHKLDFMGNFLWDKSYIFGNSRELSVDAYFDGPSNEIYMLTNYSNVHHFGVTVLDNATGTINLAKSWHAADANPAGTLDRYGFRIMEAIGNPGNLIISGYDRDENYVASDGSSQFGQSTLFVYEFVKTTGVQVGLSYQYLQPHIEPGPDEFNFWTTQMPLMYYPDISFESPTIPGTSHYYHVGYRTAVSATFTEAELYKTTNTNLRNQCDNQVLQLMPMPLTISPIPVTSGLVPCIQNAFPFNPINVLFTFASCDPALSLGSDSEKGLGLYPNPAEDFVYFDAHNLKSYSLADALGRTIESGTFNSEATIYVGGLTEGVYFVTISDTAGKIQTFKILKK